MVSNYEAMKNTYKLEGFFEGESDKKADSTSAKQNSFIIPLNFQQGDDDMAKNIYKRKDGRYMVNVQRNGVRKFKYANTKKQADIILKELRKINFQKQKKTYTLQEWSEYWLQTYKAPFMQQKNYNDLKYLVDEINKSLGSYNLNKISTMIVQEFYNKYPTSRKKEKIILYLNAILQKAVDTDIITRNPVKNVVKDKKLKFNKPPFSTDEQEKILEAIKGTDIECYIMLYLLTGIRKNELSNNVDEWLNIATNQIRVINEKHSGEYKLIDISPEYTKLLIKQKENFCLKLDYVYKKFKQILKNINIEGDLHKLRHTFATNYYYLGVPDKVISAWLGHSTTLVTKSVYIGVERKNYVEKLRQIYGNLLYKF